MDYEDKRSIFILVSVACTFAFLLLVIRATAPSAQQQKMADRREGWNNIIDVTAAEYDGSMELRSCAYDYSWEHLHNGSLKRQLVESGAETQQEAQAELQGFAEKFLKATESDPSLWCKYARPYWVVLSLEDVLTQTGQLQQNKIRLRAQYVRAATEETVILKQEMAQGKTIEPDLVYEVLWILNKYPEVTPDMIGLNETQVHLMDLIKKTPAS